MMKRKVLSLLLALGMAFSLAACGGTNNNDAAGNAEPQDQTEEPEIVEQDGTDAAGGDLAYVQDKGTLIIGITEFEPLDYQDASGNWIGFDADMAVAFAESLGVEPVFQIVEWDNKVFELEGKTIDVVWNGMTLTEEVLNSMECSNPYLSNAQVVIVPAAEAENYQTVESLKDLSFAVESGSAGKAEAEANDFAYTEVVDQATALLEVSTGTADAAIIDLLMASAMTGEGTSYDELTYTVRLNEEEYGVGFRKGSGLAAELNRFFTASYADGTMEQIADVYGIADAVIPQ